MTASSRRARAASSTPKTRRSRAASRVSATSTARSVEEPTIPSEIRRRWARNGRPIRIATAIVASRTSAAQGLTAIAPTISTATLSSTESAVAASWVPWASITALSMTTSCSSPLRTAAWRTQGAPR